MSKINKVWIAAMLFGSSLFVACGSNADAPAGVVETWYDAMVSGDAAAAIDQYYLESVDHSVQKRVNMVMRHAVDVFRSKGLIGAEHSITVDHIRYVTDDRAIVVYTAHLGANDDPGKTPVVRHDGEWFIAPR